MSVRPSLLLLAVLTSVVACAVALAACEPDAPASAEAAGPALAPAAEAPDGDEPDTPFDASDMVFEPSEPPEVVVQIPPRPPASAAPRRSFARDRQPLTPCTSSARS